MNIGTLQIDALVLGAGRLGKEERKEECFRIIDRYLDYGYRTLDVARSYENGKCEEFLGEYLQKTGKRDQIVLISKGGFPKDKTKMYLPRLSEQELTEDVENSLAALKTDRIDLYFLHRDDITKTPEELITVANRLITQDKVRYIGASNWTAGRMAQANAYALSHGLQPFVASEINYSYALTTPALTGDLTHIVMNDIEYGWYKETQFPLIAYSVQAKGFFSKQLTGETLKPSGQLSYLPLQENSRRAERITTLAKETHRSIPALLLAYVLSQPLNAAVIGGFSKVEQLVESEAGIHIRLTEQELQFLNETIN